MDPLGGPQVGFFNLVDFTRMVSLHFPGVSWASGACFQMPWLTTRTSSGPRRASASATSASAEAMSETSARSAVAWPPAPWIWATVASAAAASRA